MPSNESGEVWNDRVHKALKSKDESKYFDPCQEAAERSYRCLLRNPDSREFCKDYFEAYKECKKQWTSKWREMRSNSTSGTSS